MIRAFKEGGTQLGNSIRTNKEGFKFVKRAQYDVLGSSGPIPKHFSNIIIKPVPNQEAETMTLSNGHIMGYSICGSSSPSSPTIFFLHGLPSCRLEGLALNRAARTVGARIITPDRPGLGLSTYDPHRKFLDYPGQIAQLARHHGLSSYRVIGSSGGAPYALACAYLLPKSELKAVGVLAGVSQLDRGMGYEDLPFKTKLSIALFRWTPGLLRWTIQRAYLPIIQDPNQAAVRKMVEKQVKKLNESDKEHLKSEPETVDSIIRVLREHFKQGAGGSMKEQQLVVNPWGFRLEDIPFKGVKLWHGANDRNCPVKMGTEMAKRLRDSKLFIYPNETHLTMSKYRVEVLEELIGQ